MTAQDTAIAAPPSGAAPTPRSKRTPRSIVGHILENYGIVCVLAVLVIAISIREPNFISQQNLLNLLHQWAPIGIMAIAGTFVIIAGGFDFSVGGIFALAAVVGANLANDYGMLVAFTLPVLLGLVAGIGNGLIVTKMGVNPFIATLGTGQIFRGIALVYTGAVPVLVATDGFKTFGQDKIGPFAIAGLVMLLLFVVAEIVLARSIFGRLVYAVGGNAQASRLSGIRVDRIRIATYALSGAAAAFAGMILASRLSQGYANAAEFIEFDVVIAIVLGGTAISGGAGAIWRTFVGVALLATMENGFEIVQIDPFYQYVIKGSVLVLAVAWDEYVGRRKFRAAV
jgi:ribose transport system permease protein